MTSLKSTRKKHYLWRSTRSEAEGWRVRRPRRGAPNGDLDVGLQAETLQVGLQKVAIGFPKRL